MEEFRTRDLYLAAYLKVAAVPLLGVAHEGRLAFFIFEAPLPGVLKSLKDQYFSDQAKVHALSYAQAIKELKLLIYEGR